MIMKTTEAGEMTEEAQENTVLKVTVSHSPWFCEVYG